MPEAGPVTITGRVARITFQNPENGYTVAKLQTKDGKELLPVVGRMPGLVEGQDVSVKGKKVLHPRFGVQIEAQEVEILPPSDDQGVRKYLASGLIKGVGPKLADKVVDHLGMNTLEIIMEQPERLGEIDGIGPKRVKTIAKAVKDHGALRELMVFLQGHGITAATSLRIFRRYGSGALGVVRERPHRLASDVQGIGFVKADQIAAKLGISHDHPERITAGIEYTLSQAREQGHMYLPYEELIEKAAVILKLGRPLLGPAFARLHSQGRIAIEGECEEKPVYLAPMLAIEQRAAKALAKASRRRGILQPERAAKAVDWVAGKLLVKPSPAQAEALKTLLSAGAGVLTGGPGTGKTTMVRAVITIARAMKLRVALAAPTGRAAKRLSESCGMEASTLHRLLEFSPREMAFKRNRDRPLTADLVVVDESSMLDTWLCAHLAEALGQEARLLLVGDADQLPSVGAGLVLRQVIDSGAVKVASLKEIFRQEKAGLLVSNAHRILHGQMPELPGPGEKNADFFFLHEQEPSKAAETIKDIVTRRLPAHYGLDPVSDIQVLSPMHRGAMGCANLNELLRGALNPGAAQGGGLARGDKVMQVRNNYDLEAFNGDMGLVTGLEDGHVLVNMGERELEYTPAELDDLVHAYAVTVHKSQGSEYPAVVLSLGTEHFVMLNRPLLYTAVTRAKRLVVIVGSERALKRAVMTADPTQRYAKLDKRIVKYNMEL